MHEHAIACIQGTRLPSILTGLDGRVIAVNAPMEKLCGHPQSAFIGGVPGSVLQGGGTTKEMRQLAREVVRAGVGFFELVNYHADGSSYLVRVHLKHAGNYIVALEVSEDRGFSASHHTAERELNDLALRVQSGS